MRGNIPKPKTAKPVAIPVGDDSRWDIERATLSREVPWLARAIDALRGPYWRPGIETAAVSEDGRVYVDPCVLSWPAKALRGLLEHETWHPVLGHAARLRGLSFDELLDRVANVAADCEIHTGHLRPSSLAAVEAALQEMCTKALPGVKFDKGLSATPTNLGLPEGLTAEEYYVLLREREVEGGNGEGWGRSRSPSPGDGGKSSGSEGDSSSGGNHQTGAAPRNSTSGEPSSGESESESDGDGGGSSPSSSSSPTSDGTSPGDPSDPDRKGSGKGKPGSGDGEGQRPMRSGSSADGRKRDYETPQPGDPTEADGRPLDGITPVEIESIRRAVAEGVRQAAQHGRGDMPGGLERWADTVLAPPVVDWRALLRSALQGAVSIQGSADYSYRRPSRRNGGASRGYISPGMITPKPDIAVVIDTSGSMGTDELTEALSETIGIVRAIGGECRVASCDAGATAFRRVRQARDVSLVGGGGTDMRIGIAAAAKLKPKPQVIVIETDGDTEWSMEPPRGIRVIAVIVGPGGWASQPPDWITTIRTVQEAKR